jgi:hypothetical protein
MASIEIGPVVHVPSSGLSFASFDTDATGAVEADAEAAGTTVAPAVGKADGVDAGEQPATAIAKINSRNVIRIGPILRGSTSAVQSLPTSTTSPQWNRRWTVVVLSGSKLRQPQSTYWSGVTANPSGSFTPVAWIGQ